MTSSCQNGFERWWGNLPDIHGEEIPEQEVVYSCQLQGAVAGPHEEGSYLLWFRWRGKPIFNYIRIMYEQRIFNNVNTIYFNYENQSLKKALKTL